MVPKETGRTDPFEVVILGSPQSKANSRRLVNFGGRPRFIKSQAAMDYSTAFLLQCPVLDPLFEGDVHVELQIYYSSRRPDLDESLILDLLQGRAYRNDRQVRKKTVYGGVDRDRPRIELRIEALAGGAGPSGT